LLQINIHDGKTAKLDLRPHPFYDDPKNATPLRPLSLPGGAFADAFSAFTERDRQEFLRAYYAGVSFMDAQVGRLLDAMDRLDLWERTVVIFISDHGYHHNERNWWSKTTLFERSCRVPCIVVAPGAQSGEVCRSIVELVDLYPTVADYCGVRAPHQLAGQSLRPLLENPQQENNEAAFTLVTRGERHYGQSVRTKRWRYTRWSDGSAELYDERDDPQEVHDLSANPAMATVIEELQGRLAQIGPYEPARLKPESKLRRVRP
jgi:arylsulfatase A-like enzyme